MTTVEGFIGSRTPAGDDGERAARHADEPRFLVLDADVPHVNGAAATKWGRGRCHGSAGLRAHVIRVQLDAHGCVSVGIDIEKGAE